MRKLITLMLVFSLLVLPAAADVLTQDWQSASLDELLAAQSTLANEISARRAAEKPTAEAFSTTGTGTAILSGIEIPYTPARVTFSSPTKASLSLPGKYDHTYQVYTGGSVVELLDDPGTYNAMVTATGPWSLIIEPIKSGQTLPVSGVGYGVSDFFSLPAPVIATVSWDASGVTGMFNQITVRFCHQYKNISSWQSEVMMNELNVDRTGSMDIILQPVQGREEYCLAVTAADGLQWSISYK